MFDLLFTPKKCQLPCVLPKNIYFRVLIRLSSFLLLVTSFIKGQIRFKFHFIQFTPKKYIFPRVLPLKLRFSSPYKAIEFPSVPVTSNKGSIRVKFNFVRFTPKSANSHVFYPKITIFESTMLPSFLLPVTSNKGPYLRLSSFLLPVSSNKGSNFIFPN